MEVSGQSHDPAAILLEKNCRDFVSEAGWALELVWMIRSTENRLGTTEFEPRILQPVTY
jgi:hypothetical protein